MLDVGQSRELQAAILTLKQMDRVLKRDINREARRELAPKWQAAVSAKASTALERAVIAKGARVTVGDRQVNVKAATSRRALSGGLVPADSYAGPEWGATPKQKDVHSRSRRGRDYSYRTMVGRQFRARSKHGHVAMPAAAEMGPVLVSGWLRVIVGHLAQAFEVR